MIFCRFSKVLEDVLVIFLDLSVFQDFPATSL